MGVDRGGWSQRDTPRPRDTTCLDDSNWVDQFGPVEVETWKAAETGVYRLRTEVETTTMDQKQCTWV